MVQSLVTPFVGAQAAEYISEFAFPEGNANMLSNYMQSVQSVNYRSRSSVQNAAANIQRIFNEAGHNDVTVSVRQNAAGNFNIVVMSGFESSLQNRLSSLNTRISQTTEGGRVVASINSGGQIELVARGINDSDARNKALADARTSIGRMLGISVDNSASH